jgi:2-alkenal reductase
VLDETEEDPMKNRTYSLYIAVTMSVTAILIVAAIAFTGGLVLAPHLSGEAQAAEQLQLATSDVMAAYEQAFIEVYQNTLPSVVSIRVTKQIDRGFLDPSIIPGPEPEEEPDSPEEEEEPEGPPEFFNRGGGTGFVWDTAGHIVTNYHVVADATDVEVIFADDTMVKAEVVGSDPDADLAVIKVDVPASELKPVMLGDSDTIQVGQLSIAIGNPFGQEFTMTSGIVSGVGRTIRSGNSGFSIPEVIQTDAPINPGNSGGPLLNRQGEVIGINAQMLSQTGASSGIGFAVPVNIAKQVVPTLVKGETYKYPWLGISGGSLTVEAIEFRKLPPETRGAVVTGLIEDGPAAKAGLQGPDEDLPIESEEFLFGGDVITAINGEAITDMNDLITYLVEATQPGNKVTLDVIRSDGTEEQVEVTLGVRPSSLERPGQEDD